MGLDLCWFTNASMSLSSSCRNLATENRHLHALGPAALLRPLYSHSLPPRSFWSPGPPEGPYLSDCTDKGTSAFSRMPSSISFRVKGSMRSSLAWFQRSCSSGFGGKSGRLNLK